MFRFPDFFPTTSAHAKPRGDAFRSASKKADIAADSWMVSPSA
jgi:hypothetical protein